MADFPMISPLSDAELDAVTGGTDGGGDGGGGTTPSDRITRIRQNARGGDSISFGGNGGNATASGVGGVATGGAGGVSGSAVGGAGGTNSITGPL